MFIEFIGVLVIIDDDIIEDDCKTILEDTPPIDPDKAFVVVLQQCKQVHVDEQETPAWKHSQYFFRHMDFRQRQPLLCAMTFDVPINGKVKI